MRDVRRALRLDRAAQRRRVEACRARCPSARRGTAPRRRSRAARTARCRARRGTAPRARRASPSRRDARPATRRHADDREHDDHDRGKREQEADEAVAQSAHDLLAPRLREQVLGVADRVERVLALDHDDRHHEVRDERPRDADQRDHDAARGIRRAPTSAFSTTPTVEETTAHAAICGRHATAARRLPPIVGSPPRSARDRRSRRARR